MSHVCFSNIETNFKMLPIYFKDYFRYFVRTESSYSTLLRRFEYSYDNRSILITHSNDARVKNVWKQKI